MEKKPKIKLLAQQKVLLRDVALKYGERYDEVYEIVDGEKKLVSYRTRQTPESRDRVNELAKEFARDPLLYHVPNGANERYIKTVAKAYDECQIPVVLVNSANGVGKTTETVNILLNIIFDTGNGWYEGSLFEDEYRYPKSIWYCSEDNAFESEIAPLFKSLIPEGRCKWSKAGKPVAYPILWEFDNGWTMHFKTYGQAKEAYESSNLGIIVCDEPPPEHIWNALISRGRNGCLYMLPMTPLECEPYIIDDIYERAVSDDPEFGFGYYNVECSVYEACSVRGVRGHLDKGKIDLMVKRYPPEQVESRVYGKFTHFKEKIYDFNEETHVVEPYKFPINRNYIFGHTLDPHDGRMGAGIFWMYDKKMDRFIIVGESPEKNNVPFWKLKMHASPIDEIEAFCKIEDRLGFPLNPYRNIDKRFGFQTRLGSNLATKYSECGRQLFPKYQREFVYNPSYDAPTQQEVAYGHGIVSEYLKIREDGYAGLLVWNTCYHTINGMLHYIREKPRTARQDNTVAGTMKPVEKFKDFPDAVRYMCCAYISKNIKHYWMGDKQQQKKLSRRQRKRIKKRTNDPYIALGRSL